MLPKNNIKIKPKHWSINTSPLMVWDSVRLPDKPFSHPKLLPVSNPLLCSYSPHLPFPTLHEKVLLRLLQDSLQLFSIREHRGTYSGLQPPSIPPSVLALAPNYSTRLLSLFQPILPASAPYLASRFS